MCNITFEVPRLSTFVFKKSSDKKKSTIIFVVKSLKGFGWNNVGPASQTVTQHYFTIGPMYCVIRVGVFRGIKCHPYGSPSKHRTITQFCFNVDQRRIRSTGIEPAMGCDAGPALYRYWVGRPTLCVPGTSYRRVHRVISRGGGRNRPTR